MELPVPLQLRELLWAVAAGAGFGLLYDLLGPLRRGRITGALTDLLYSLAVFCGLFFFTLYAGRGRLRIFAVFGICGGLGAYLWAWSGPIRTLRDLVCRALSAPFRWAAAGCRLLMKFFSKNAKKLLHLTKNMVK